MLPRVSFLVPVYNEQQHLGEALASIADQEYPPGQIEIVVAEGGSSDGTRQVLDAFQQRRPDVALVVVENPSRNTAVGRNLCLKSATGSLVLNFSGHAVAEPRLLSVLVEKLAAQPENVAGAGCAIVGTAPASAVGRAVAAALGSPLGGGGSMDSSYNAAKDRYARSLAFCVYRRAIVDKVGGFDPAFWCGQDAELNRRLSQGGYRLLFTPETHVRHYKRTSLTAFARQMHQYGVARAMIVRKFPASLRPVFLLPAAWVACLIFAAAASCMSKLVALSTLVAAAMFVIVSGATTALAGGGSTSVLLSPLILALLYTSYGIGFWRGLLRRRA